MCAIVKLFFGISSCFVSHSTCCGVSFVFGLLQPQQILKKANGRKVNGMVKDVQRLPMAIPMMECTVWIKDKAREPIIGMMVVCIPVNLWPMVEKDRDW
jgi:hypothetical protein